MVTHVTRPASRRKEEQGGTMKNGMRLCGVWESKTRDGRVYLAGKIELPVLFLSASVHAFFSFQIKRRSPTKRHQIMLYI